MLLNSSSNSSNPAAVGSSSNSSNSSHPAALVGSSSLGCRPLQPSSQTAADGSSNAPRFVTYDSGYQPRSSSDFVFPDTSSSDLCFVQPCPSSGNGEPSSSSGGISLLGIKRPYDSSSSSSGELSGSPMLMQPGSSSSMRVPRGLLALPMPAFGQAPGLAGSINASVPTTQAFQGWVPMPAAGH
jgi:hypothetical protein